MKDKGERIRGRNDIKVVFDVGSVTVFFLLVKMDREKRPNLFFVIRRML